MSQEQDKAFFRNFTIVLVILSALMVFFMVAGVMFGEVKHSPEKAAAEVMNNTKPVAEMQMEGDEPEVAAVEEEASAGGNEHAGKATYDSVCIACHGSGIPAIPQLGDDAAWAPRIEQGMEVLYQNAILGYVGASGMPMPAKGGNPNISDDEVKAAVDYMTGNTGSASETTPAADASSANADAGQGVYNSSCAVCHATGVPGVPQVGDAEAWAPRIAKGNDTLYTNAIAGFVGTSGMMPPKGGNVNLSDDEVKAAVDHMVNNSQ